MGYLDFVISLLSKYYMPFPTPTSGNFNPSSRARGLQPHDLETSIKGAEKAHAQIE
jgi:hypothetical protein